MNMRDDVKPGELGYDAVLNGGPDETLKYKITRGIA